MGHPLLYYYRSYVITRNPKVLMSVKDSNLLYADINIGCHDDNDDDGTTTKEDEQQQQGTVNGPPKLEI